MRQRTIHLRDISQLGGKQLLISWPGHQMMAKLEQPMLHLGRFEQGNDIIVSAPAVSRYHATLRWDGATYEIIDGQTRENQNYASSNGLYLNGQRISQHRLANGDVIRIPGQNENFIVLTYLDDAAASTHAIEAVPLNQEIQIGRSQDNQLRLPDPLVSASHAVISPTPNGHLLRDLNSSNGTYVNGQRIREATLQPNALIQLGSTQLRYTGSELVAADLAREGIRLDAVNIHKEVKVKKASPNAPDIKILIDNISLSILPREFVAIVGGSGTGKSTMLDALNGFRPAEGQVLLNGDNLYQNFNAYRHTIGYVPQDDIIHRELTVAESLRYVARLRLPPDTEPAEIESRIDAVLEQMAMPDRKELLIKELSGGQRKRVSIAVELIADPAILFLDEPTSGLDPGLDQKMMFTLRQVANAGKTVILVTHATDNIFDCHLVLFLAAGGRLVFFGPPKEALTFFGVNNFAEIYNLVDQEAERWIQAYQTSAYYQRYVQQRLAASGSNKQAPETTTAHKSGESRLQKIKRAVRQTAILTQRYLTMLIRDRRNLLLLLAQAPLIAFLLFFVIENRQLFSPIDDKCTLDYEKNEYINHSLGLPCAYDHFTTTEISDIQKFLFMLACVAIWLGLFSASREIVKELAIYRRERLVNLSIPAYVSSKLLVLFGLSLIQAFVLVLMLHLWANFPASGVIGPGIVEIFITMSLVTFTAACFGLFLSAVMGREDRIMSVMPGFLILQIVFAGIVFPAKSLTEHPETWSISIVTFSRWGIEAMGSTLNMPALMKVAQRNQNLGEELPLFFDFTSNHLLQSWGILFGFAMFSIILTIFALKRQDVH